MMPTTFERDSAVVAVGGGSYEARLDTRWWVQRGPNGGYLAAILMRAFAATVDDVTRAPRSLTVHFVAPPGEGVVSVRTKVERAGRSLTSVSARMQQGDRLIAVAVAAFSKPRPGPEFCDLVMPEAAGPDTIAARPAAPEAPAIARRWDIRWAVGEPPFEGPRGHEAIGGGWIRLEEPQLFDAAAVAAVTDAWIPPIFTRTNQQMVVPTIDLTVHFRAALPHPTLGPEGFLFAVFRTNVAAGGFLEEDGEVWAPDGTLLAQSRQLAAMLPLG
jgi:acyl-CoA thioesterase